MTTLYLIRLPIDLPALYRWAGDRGWAARRNPEGGERSAIFDEGRALHHLLAESFGKGVLQPFRLLPAPGKRHANLYAYASAGKSALADMLRACALPEVLSICDSARIDEKELPPGLWRPGRRLGFETRIRPVRRLLKPCGKFPKGAEVDAFLVEGLRRYPDGPPDEETDRLKREDVYERWLAERLGGAADLEAARLARFERHRAARNKRAIKGPDVVMQGDLVVRDPTLFAERLAKGVGRHTAYGFGMLLVRPPGRTPC
jgi:CRISPR system Cascade subunit CasE